MYSIMIRKNSLLCKLIRIKTSSKFLFDTFMAQFRPELETCPICNSTGNCHIHDYYRRSIIDFDAGQRTHAGLCVLRVFCDSCEHAHAVLPDAHDRWMVLSLPLPYDVEKHPKEAFFMSKDTETIKRDAEAAQFRFALIAPVIQGLFPDTSATAYYKRVTASPLTLPDGSIVSYSYKTLEKWKSQYKIGGLDALMPNTRSDKWFSRALNEEAIAIIYRRILMYSSFYGLTFNPFGKQQLKEKDHFISRDFTEMTNWLNYPKDIRGIGVFTALPGMGKSYALRCFAASLNPSLFHIEYLCLSTISVADFYKQLCFILGVPEKATKPGCSRLSRNRSPIFTKKNASRFFSPLMKHST